MVYLMEGHIQVENFLLSIQAITKLAQGMGIRCDFTDNMQDIFHSDSADRTLAWLIHSMSRRWNTVWRLVFICKRKWMFYRQHFI